MWWKCILPLCVQVCFSSLRDIARHSMWPVFLLVDVLMAELSLVVKIMKRVSQLADTENVKGTTLSSGCLYMFSPYYGVFRIYKKDVIVLNAKRDIQDCYDF